MQHGPPGMLGQGRRPSSAASSSSRSIACRGRTSAEAHEGPSNADGACVTGESTHPEHDLSNSTHDAGVPRRHATHMKNVAVVVGGSIGGLLAGLVLAEVCDEVVLVERGE